MPKKLMSLVQLSDATDLSIPFLVEAIGRGDLHAERVSGRWVVDKEDAAEFLSELECDDDDDDGDDDLEWVDDDEDGDDDDEAESSP